MHLTSLLLLSALGASAHPSGHAHLHRAAHQKRAPIPKPDPAVGDIVTATIEGKVVTWTNTYDGKGSPFIKNDKPAVVSSVSSSPPAAPTVPVVAAAANKPASTSAPAPASSSVSTPDSGSGSVSAQGVSSFTSFCNGNSASRKRATAAEIAYKGNTGTPGNWGCNMLLVADAATADKYKYTAKFTNGKEAQSCTCFNKIGPTGLIDGFFHEGITWKMAPGVTQYVAFDSNTQGGCVCNAGSSLRKTTFGQFASTWLEFDFENTSNNGWSGADASALVPMKYGLQVDGMKVCYAGVCSTILPGGTGTNAYLGGMEDLDGVGLNIVPGKCQLDVQVGYTG